MPVEKQAKLHFLPRATMPAGCERDGKVREKPCTRQGLSQIMRCGWLPHGLRQQDMSGLQRFAVKNASVAVKVLG